MFDERFFRMWEFYLAGCEIAFQMGRPGCVSIPINKELYIYTYHKRLYLSVIY